MPAATAGAFLAYETLVRGRDWRDPDLLKVTAALAGTAFAGTVLFDELAPAILPEDMDVTQRWTRRFPEVGFAMLGAAAATAYVESGSWSVSGIRGAMMQSGLVVGGAAMASQLTKETLFGDA